MSRTRIAGLAALALLGGCQTQPEQLRVPPAPLEGQTLTYRDTVTRARMWATNAVEAFYVDKWAEVESSANGLEETARFLPKSLDIPDSRRSTLEVQATALQQDAQDLRRFARNNDEKKANETLQRIHQRVRDLRPE